MMITYSTRSFFKTRVFFKFIVLTFLLLTPTTMTTIVPTYAAESAEGDPVPPTGNAGGGGGGGGGILFYDYYLPLVFAPTDIRQGSTILITSGLPGYVILDFLFENASAFYLYAGEMLSIPYSRTSGMKNGSLIRTTQPMQITVTELTNDEGLDYSSGYTVLPKRMHGFEYFNPFENVKAAVFTLYKNTSVSVLDQKNTRLTYMKIPKGETTIINAPQNTKILTSNPSIIVLYRYNLSLGSFTSLAAPSYLWGATYKFSLARPMNATQINQLILIHVTATNTTNVVLTRSDNSESRIHLNAFETKTLVVQTQSPTNELREIHALAPNTSLTVSIEYLWLQGLNVHVAAFQAWSLEEMFAAELFSMPAVRSSIDYRFAPLDTNARIAFLGYDPENQSFFLTQKGVVPVNQTESILSLTLVNQSLTFISSSIGFATAYVPGSMGLLANPSFAFPLTPNNPSTYYSDKYTATSTWYRIPDLNIKSITTIPTSPKEFNAVKYKVTINNNGSIPSSLFVMQIYVNNNLKFNTSINKLKVNETRSFELSEFYYLGERDINLTVSLDTTNQVTEFNENNNRMTILIHISLNYQLRISVALFVFGVLVYFLYRQGKKLMKKRSIRKGDVDAVLTLDELT